VTTESPAKMSIYDARMMLAEEHMTDARTHLAEAIRILAEVATVEGLHPAEYYGAGGRLFSAAKALAVLVGAIGATT
jgi:hypothetical protein